MNINIEEALDKITEQLPEVAGNGWYRKQDLPDGTKIYEIRVKEVSE